MNTDLMSVDIIDVIIIFHVLPTFKDYYEECITFSCFRLMLDSP